MFRIRDDVGVEKRWFFTWLMAILTSALPLFFAVPSSHAQCPKCTQDLKQDPVVPAGTELLEVPMKWCAMEDAPSIDDPDLVCEDNFKDVLWRRHERASECILIPQCRITLRSGSAAPKSNFTTLQDVNTSVGQPGDLIFSDSGFLPLNADLEINERLVACDANWMNQPKGILTLALGRFTGAAGQASAIRGLAAPSMTTPVVLIVDPESIPSGVDVEHVLAHEVGHILGLCHPDEAGCGQAPGAVANLMHSQGSVNATELTANQCTIARASSAFELIEEFFDPGFVVDAALDNIGELNVAADLAAADLRKVMLADATQLDSGLRAYIATQGLVGTEPVSYRLALDTDNDPATGGQAFTIYPEMKKAGTEVLLSVTVDQAHAVTDIQAHRFVGNIFEPLSLPLKAKAQPIMIYVYTDQGNFSEPWFTEVEFLLEPAVLSQLGLPIGPLFPNGLTLEAASLSLDENGNRVTDSAPDTPRVLTFPTIRFPTVELSHGQARCATDQISIDVKGLTPNQQLKVILGEERLIPGVDSDDNGNALFTIDVPDGFPPGDTLVTIGSLSPDDAVTADAVVSICETPVPHFQIYRVRQKEVDHRLRLIDQFAPDAKRATLVSLTHFANPTMKGTQGVIADPDYHLTWYALRQPQAEPRRTIRFRNQFGQHSVDVKDPRFLLVPAQKLSDPGSRFPTFRDHYKCYAVVEINSAPPLPVVSLHDQFGTEPGVQVGKPRLFCNPVKKIRPGEPPQGIVNAVDHLAIYDLPPSPRPVRIKALDQFGKRALRVRESVMLAVPSEKQAVVPHDN